MARYETRTLPAHPSAADDRAALLADGYAERVVGETAVYTRRVTDGPRAPDTLERVVGAKPAHALRAAGYADLGAVLATLAGPDARALADVPGVGEATLAKLSDLAQRD